MLKLNEEKTVLEGELKLSDCEREFVVKWLSGSSQASFFIGDTQDLKDDIKAFIHGKKICHINLESYLTYLKKVKQISTKYKSMYYGPFDKIDHYISKFSYMNPNDAIVILSYETDDRYIRILNDKIGYKDNVIFFGDLALKNGDDFRHSFMGGITNIRITKKLDDYMLEIELIDNWRDVIMQEKGKKVDLESLINIFNDEMNQNIMEGKNEEEAAQIFGVKYAPLLENNKEKFTFEDIVDGSLFNKDEVKKSLEKGMKISSSVLWEADIVEKEDSVSSKSVSLPTRSPRTIKIHPLNAILYGAPGTGKTYATAEYAVAIIENRDIKEEPRDELMNKYKQLQKEGKITFTTFHQSYGYEDFIQGLRPENNDGVMEFNPVDGVFKRIADKALSDNNSNYVIIIDEINRANMSKVLGELITLIEEDKRWGEVNELSVTLPSGEVFVVPNNLYIVGTMNTADKSISIIDVALRRRFEFIEQQVDLSKVADTKLRDVLKKINEKLKDETDSTDLLVGHAYFMNKTLDDLDKLLNRAIIPLLYEYFFDSGKKVKSVVEEAIKDTGLKVDSSALGRIKVVKE